MGSFFAVRAMGFGLFCALGFRGLRALDLGFRVSAFDRISLSRGCLSNPSPEGGVLCVQKWRVDGVDRYSLALSCAQPDFGSGVSATTVTGS